MRHVEWGQVLMDKAGEASKKDSGSKKEYANLKRNGFCIWKDSSGPLDP